MLMENVLSMSFERRRRRDETLKQFAQAEVGLLDLLQGRTGQPLD
jgi:hypothetical protein